MKPAQARVAGTAGCAGFTLLEVMLAFVLLATAMGLLIGMLATGLRQVRQAQSETEATLYAQSTFDQIGVLEAIEPGQDTGTYDRGRYRYELEITEVEDPALSATAAAPTQAATTVGAPKLYRIALAVSWGAGQAAQQLHFATLRARAPPLTGPGTQ